MRIVSLLLGIALLIGCSNAGTKGPSRVVEQQTVKQNTVDFINGLGQASPRKKALELTVTPGSGVYNDAISYSKEISNPQGMAQYTGAFMVVESPQDPTGVHHHIYVIDDALSKLEHVHIIRLYEESKNFQRNLQHAEGEVLDVLLSIYEYEIERAEGVDNPSLEKYGIRLNPIRERTNYDYVQGKRQGESDWYLFRELLPPLNEQVRIKSEYYTFRKTSTGSIYINDKLATRIAEGTPLATPKMPPRPKPPEESSE